MADLTQTEECIEAIRKAAEALCSETNKLRDSMIRRVTRQYQGKVSNGDIGEANEIGGNDTDLPLHFQPGDIDVQKIQAILGRLEANADTAKNARLRKMASFQITNQSVDVLVSTSREHAWLCDHLKNLCLVDKDGKTLVKRKLDHVPESITISDDGTVYFTSYREKAIKKLDVSGKITYVLNTSPLHPVGLSLANEGDLLICVVDKFDFVTGKNKPKDILKVKIDRGEVKSVKFKDDSEKLTAPYRILENTNGDVLVIDGLSETSGRLVVFNDVGGVKFTYSGDDTGNGQPFCPTNMCIDHIGNIFVVDGGSHCIHVLNSVGELQRKIISDEIGGVEPTILSIGQDGIMWVGHANGEVAVYRYRRSHRASGVSRVRDEKETFF
ncbi:uncharacterized protein LOC110451267 [Mizuhopecten yessoensis]|uniref:Tripartite motif-containing protein 2 n=1 Tax=Mizuhopecten yessoensis TaxID=6573 RepID=A0A210QM04_MIZYE|nr:uncharacterized protein LOC110451267 [Mizuhopecten yessoensis]OWF49766.1 Tripartite motif-containing protein 2 [Mizuhopecten yessoensis]